MISTGRPKSGGVGGTLGDVEDDEGEQQQDHYQHHHEHDDGGPLQASDLLAQSYGFRPDSARQTPAAGSAGQWKHGASSSSSAAAPSMPPTTRSSAFGGDGVRQLDNHHHRQRNSSRSSAASVSPLVAAVVERLVEFRDEQVAVRIQQVRPSRGGRVCLCLRVSVSLSAPVCTCLCSARIDLVPAVKRNYF